MKMRFVAPLFFTALCAGGLLADIAPLEGHPEWGYTVSGLGNNGDETAVVFTNHTETATWTVPTDLTDIKFLVVGGGGGAGAGTGGGGGGGGGVVTGLVHSLTKNTVVTAKVGAGGAGGSGNVGAGSAGSSSYFKVDDMTYVTANGGGQGGGSGSAGKVGGSGAGGRAGNKAGGSATQGSIAPNASALVTAVLFGNAGGAGAANFSAGGGGGATGAGASAPSNDVGGDGGAGLVCEITGTSSTYGAGGGGGTSRASTVKGSRGGYGGGVSSGSGAGKGGGGKGGTATSGTANRGGGGGGGGGNAASGGAGGSGIVAFRYTVASGTAVVPTIASKVYNGETQAADIVTDGFAVMENDGGVDVGTYDVVLATLGGYVWDTTGASGTITIQFSITLATNTWTTEPSISKASWTAGVDEPGIVTNGATRFGAVTATIAKDGGAATAFDGTISTAVGEYVMTYTAPAATANYAAPETTTKTLTFAILSADTIPPYEITVGTLFPNAERTLSIPYSLSCDVTTTKTADLYARYAVDGATTTNTAQIATSVALGGGSGTGTIADLMPGTNYWVAIYAVVETETSEPTAPVSVTIPGPATDFSTSATFTNDPMEFILSGSLTPGLGTTTVTLHWSVGTNSLDNSASFVFQHGDDAAFSTNIAYGAFTDTLSWNADISTTFTTATYGTQTWAYSTAPETKDRKDTAAVTYTWTGAGADNLWTNLANWSANRTPNYGCPDASVATAKFTSPASVDLDGGTFTLRGGDGNGLSFSPNLGEVMISTGILSFASTDDRLFGASGTTVVFDSVSLNGLHGLKFTANSPTVFSGTSTQSWLYEPWGVNGTELIVRDGTMESGLFQTWFTSDRVHHATISNAVWTIRASTNPVLLGNVAYFRDGEEWQGRVVSLGKLKLGYTYDIVVPAKGHDMATLTAATLDTSSSSCIFKLDVTDWRGGKKVPLVTFTGADQSTAIEKVEMTLRAYAKGVNATAKRGAELVWSAADNTLYYKQKPQGGTTLVLQ